MAFVISISVIFNNLYKLSPFNSKLFENFRINLNCFILMQLLMNSAKVLIIFGRLPALFMIANIYFLNLSFIISEIRPYCREHFSSNRDLKIFIRNDTVTIDIEFIENLNKLIFCDFKTPKVKIKLKFSSTYFTSFFNIQIHKSFSESFPLKHNFF